MIVTCTFDNTEAQKSYLLALQTAGGNWQDDNK